MATLTLNETTCESTGSTRIDLVSRPRQALALSAARDEVIALRQAQESLLRQAQESLSGRRRGVVGDLAGHPYALAAPYGPSNGRSQCDNRLAKRPAAVINPSKSIKSTDEGVNAVNHDGMGAFVTSLGSRPPSPPV